MKMLQQITLLVGGMCLTVLKKDKAYTNSWQKFLMLFPDSSNRDEEWNTKCLVACEQFRPLTGL